MEVSIGGEHVLVNDPIPFIDNTTSPLHGIIVCLRWLSMNNVSIVRHEVAQEMRVWPLGVGLQEQASNHLKLLWSKAIVVSVIRLYSPKETSFFMYLKPVAPFQPHICAKE